MYRRVRTPLALVLLAAAPTATAGTLIDSFETGGFSMSMPVAGQSVQNQVPDAGHCISSNRTVILDRFVSTTGAFTAELVPFQNVDDAVEVTFPFASLGGRLTLSWDNGLWDLTEGGTQNQIAARVTGGGVNTNFGLYLEDAAHNSDTCYLTYAGDTTYRFPFSAFDDVDLGQIIAIELSVQDATGETVRIENVETSSASILGLVYEAWEPHFYTWLCGPRGGGPAIGWDWAIGTPAQPGLAGPQLQIQGISGADCAGVELVAESSGGGGFGEVAIVTVDWLASTFDNAQFDLRFVTDPAAGYVAQLVGDPTVEMFSQGFRITHTIHVEDVFGIPDGDVRQELIVARAPGQEIWLDYVEALPLGGPTEVGYSLAFSYTGAVFDPGQPLLEIYTTSGFEDDAGATGVEIADAVDPLPTLRAIPGVTRTGTRFVIAGEPRGTAAIEVFDVTGRRVRRLEARNGEAAWDATVEGGARAPAGVYFGRLRGSGKAARVVLLR